MCLALWANEWVRSKRILFFNYISYENVRLLLTHFVETWNSIPLPFLSFLFPLYFSLLVITPKNNIDVHEISPSYFPHFIKNFPCRWWCPKSWPFGPPRTNPGTASRESIWRKCANVICCCLQCNHCSNWTMEMGCWRNFGLLVLGCVLRNAGSLIIETMQTRLLH